MRKMEKLIKDGAVAVVVSTGFGAGWSTWNSNEEFLSMNKRIAEAVLNKDFDLVKEICEKEFNGGYVCYAGLCDCEVRWVQLGVSFTIRERDGAEYIQFESQGKWTTA